MKKLVRDRIPEIIKNDNLDAVFYVADSEEYYKVLIEKLNEEVREFIESNNVEELADIMEVVYALAEYNRLDEIKLNELRNDKAIKKGKFKNRIVLKEVLKSFK